MLGGEVGGRALRLAVDDEVDVALAVEHHVLRAVLRHQREAELLEHRLERAGLGRGELDEFEAHQAHRVVEQVGHRVLRARACGSAHALQFCSEFLAPARRRTLRCRTSPAASSSLSSRTRLAGAPRISERSGKVLPSVTMAPAPTRQLAADHGAVHHHRLDADQRPVADGAAVQHRLVADRDARRRCRAESRGRRAAPRLPARCSRRRCGSARCRRAPRRRARRWRVRRA